MNAYKFAIPGVNAIVMAEDDEAVIQKMFGHLETTREQQHGGDGLDEPHLVARGGIRRLDDGDEGRGTIVVRIEVWSNEVKFLPPEGQAN